ncbi:hypothetical protein [Romboutsia hominis]|uniref:Uncharacterized protein n=1 Tax=Romboutsia hominis TaxID=1507512 RepID=A0A2P2BSH9_9FIRM|nr:hypothetical protein [Romboutsia hominis]CEI73300.1 Hypothetical protein FRIFI_1769 [Romboutsia hominis]
MENEQDFIKQKFSYIERKLNRELIGQKNLSRKYVSILKKNL